MDSAPFRLDLDATPLQLSAGEKQKLEILKQLLPAPRLLILDEPTSVLTPQEADEVLGALRDRAHAGACSVAHDHPQVPRGDRLRRRRDGAAPRPLVGSLAVADAAPSLLASMMVGAGTDGDEARRTAVRAAKPPVQRSFAAAFGGEVQLQIEALQVAGDRGEHGRATGSTSRCAPARSSASPASRATASAS